MKNLIFVLLLIICSVISLNSQSKMAVGAGLVVALPIGTFGDVVGTGFGGTGSFEMSFGKNITGIGQIGYISWSGEEFAGYSYSYSAVPFFSLQVRVFMERLHNRKYRLVSNLF